jgi:Carboxypeptidase regulatory-like domain
MDITTLILFLTATTGGAAAQSGCIAGKILDYAGSPLAQMQINISEQTHAVYFTTHTDEEGHFFFEDLPPGNYDIVTHNEDLGYPDSNNVDFSRKIGRLSVVVTESRECTPITIQRELRAGKLRLNLTDASTGEVIAKPEANFRRIDGFHAWNGVSLHGLDLLVPPSKPLEVRVGAKGYDSSDILRITPLQPGEVRELALVLRRIGVGCLSGTVVDAANLPVPKIRVQPLLLDNQLDAKALFTRTDEHGRFQVRDLHPGVYQLSVDDKERGYDGFSTMKTYDHIQQATVVASPECTETIVELNSPSATLHAEFLDATTHDPIKHFKFRVRSAIPKQWWYVESMTNDALVPPDRPCSIVVEADGYRTSEPLSLGKFESGEIRQLRIELQRDGPSER